MVRVPPVPSRRVTWRFLKRSPTSVRAWDGLRELIAADARLRVADRFVGLLSDSPYFSNYERSTTPWRLAVGELDGEPVIIRLRRDTDRWTPATVVRLDVTDHRIVWVADYSHCPWILPAATSVLVPDLS
jgi:RNA polymerase sigma-70 factor, ECF subfamily